MRTCFRWRPASRLATLLALGLPLAGFAQAPTVTSLSPARNQRNAPRASNVAVTFDRPMQFSPSSASSVKVISYQRGGVMRGSTRGSVNVVGNTITFDPTNDFKPGERVDVTVTTDARSTGGVNLATPHVHQFTAAAGGTGQGTFLPGSDAGAGSYPESVAVGDVNGDGDLDLLTANFLGNSVSVRLNNGTGTFSGGSDVAVGTNPKSVAVGDLDGDGDLDFATTNRNSHSVSVRLNDGTGAFSGTQNIATGNNTYPSSVAVGDMDGDGDLDLVVVAFGANAAAVYFNDGSGAFSAGLRIGLVVYPQSVAVGDVDGDGDLDILTAHYYRNLVSVSYNDGTGGFTSAYNGTLEVPVGADPNSLAVADVDADGDLDILTANTDGGTVSVRLNDGAGSFGGGSDPSVGSYPISIATGDVDADGDLDLLVTNVLSSTASVRFNDGAGTFSGTQVVTTGAGPQGVALGDVDSDGDLDVLTANRDANSVSVRLNQPTPPDLVISGYTVRLIPAGTYRNIDIYEATARMEGDIVVTGALVVHSGILQANYDGPCYRISGPGSFTLGADGALIVCSPDGISASGPTGSIQVNGARTFSPHASYYYESATPQITGTGLPARVRLLYDTNPTVLTLSQPLQVRVVLAVEPGDFDLNGQALTLLSDADTTAYAVNGESGRILGTATVQQYLTPNPGAAIGYRFFSSPVQNTTVADLAVPGRFTPVVNGAFNVSNSASVRPYPNVFGYDETRGGATAPFSRGYFSPTALTNALVPGRGYSVACPPATYDFVGQLTTGDVTVPNLTRTGTTTPGGKPGWHLLGNPYPGPIVWDAVSVPAGMSPTIYVQKTLGGSNYVYLTRTITGTFPGTGTLPDGLVVGTQGFFAQVTGASPVSFTFTNDLRPVRFLGVFTTPHYRASPTPTAAPATLALTLRAANAPAEEQDAAFVIVSPGTTPDPALAAGERPGRNVGAPTLALLTGEGREQAFSSLPEADLTRGATRELLAVLPAAGTYELTLGEWTNLTDAADAILLDRLTDTRYPLGTTVRFTATEASEVRGRFVLLFGQRVLGTSHLAPLTSDLAVWPNPATGAVQISGATGAVELLDVTSRIVRQQPAT